MEEELQRIILDLHDGAVQKLFAAASHLALLQAQLDAQAPAVRADLEPALIRSTLLIESALQDIRTTLSTFRNPEFQDRSLSEILQDLTKQHQLLTGHSIDFQLQDAPQHVSLPVKIVLYRVLQESLSNAYRHSGVNQAVVYLRSQQNMIVLEIVDRGRGFELANPQLSQHTTNAKHIGLCGMRERVELVGGELQLISQPGQGTRVIVQVPYDG